MYKFVAETNSSIMTWNNLVTKLYLTNNTYPNNTKQKILNHTLPNQTVANQLIPNQTIPNLRMPNQTIRNLIIKVLDNS